MSINSNISDVLVIIGYNVKKYRIEKEYTQQDLAFYCGKTDKSTISNIERGACNGFNISTLIKISLALEIEPIRLFEK